MNRIIFKIFFIIVFFNIQNVALASWIKGTVIGVSDGDTITVLDTKKNNYKIRLDQIDAPELRMPYGFASKKTLSDLIYKKEVSVELHNKDAYNRHVGTVYLGDANINLFMVRSGYAWAYNKYVRELLYLEAEKAARLEKRGLWEDSKEPVPPWEWRSQRKNNK